MGQIAPPNVDVAPGLWTPQPVFRQINADYVNPNDPTFVTSGNVTGDAFTVALLPIAFPNPQGGPQTLTIRLRKTTTDNSVVSLMLLCQGAVVAYRSIAASQITQAFTTYSFPLTATEIAAINNYASLRLRVQAGVQLITTCVQCPTGAASQFTLFPAPGNATCNCSFWQSGVTLAYQSGCTWASPHIPVTCLGYQDTVWWTLSYLGASGRVWVLSLTGTVMLCEYASAVTGWDCQSSLPFTLTSGPVAGCAWANTVTIHPA